jgi:hypothetical protein
MSRSYSIAMVLIFTFLAIAGIFASVSFKPTDLFDEKVWSKPIKEQVVQVSESSRNKADLSSWGVAIGSIGLLLIFRRRN